ncbi:MAG: DNA helicase [Pirellulaceae bacterium]|nr:MAG: DNA helicase [Pirellulaceae bacterium]
MQWRSVAVELKLQPAGLVPIKETYYGKKRQCGGRGSTGPGQAAGYAVYGNRSMDSILRKLTEAQRQAVTHVEGPLLVLAGPGSGKTRVVTHRVAYLLKQGVWPSQIVALTFTNKAADEMARRVADLVPGRRVWISTFHSFCARLLREFASLVGLEPNFSIYDTDASLQVAKRALEEAEVGGRLVTAEKLLQRISYAKAHLMNPEEFAAWAQDPFSRAAANVYPIYQRLLLEANAVDFDDLLMHVAVLLRDEPELRAALDERYRFILVDEYQDTNLAQYAIVRGLSIDHPHLAATGDPDQSIYGWRGADISNIARFEEDYPQRRVVRLEENFRSTQRIVRAAAELIAHNRRRKAKSMFTRNPPGAPVRLVRYRSAEEEAEQIAAQILFALSQGRQPADFGIFYRTNALSRVIEQALRRAGIPYQVVRGLEFYQRREIKDLLAYLYLLHNPRDDEAFRRVIHVPPRGIGQRTLVKLLHFTSERPMPLLAASRRPEFLQRVGRQVADAFEEFHRLFDGWRGMVDQPVHEILQRIIDDINYLEYLQALDDAADVDRPANVRELLADAQAFHEAHGQTATLERFLERMALVSDTDRWDERASKVSLMTLHAAKGLEFPVVFIVGIEDGLLPHERSRQDDEAWEEERRLLFVGMTRAQQELQLSFADRRAAYGNNFHRIPSPFLQELPLAEMERVGWGATVGAVCESETTDDLAHEPPIDDVPSWQVDGERPSEISHDEEANAYIIPWPGTITRKTKRRRRVARNRPEANDRSRPQWRYYKWQAGDRVVHPTHGPGTVVRTSGRGKRCIITVQFDRQPDSTLSFCAAYSPLEPYGGPVPDDDQRL